MHEIVVWILISMGNTGASHVVDIYKKPEQCEETRMQLFTPRTAKCIKSTVAR